jgi:vacuolar-type H+-ATPase subunit I/STV1
LTKDEYLEKKEKFETQKKRISTQTQNIQTAKENLDKLKHLLENGIITKNEYDSKVSDLKGLREVQYGINDLELESPMFYISRANQYGPITVSNIIKRVKSGEVNPNSLIRHQDEIMFSKRAKDLLIIDVNNCK